MCRRFQWSHHYKTLGVCLLAVTERLALANVVGPDMQNFNATPDGLDFVTVQSSETLRRGYWNLGLLINHAKGTLPRFLSDGSQRPIGQYDDALTGLDVNVAFGLTSRLTIGLSLPHIVAQTVRDDEGGIRGEFIQNGMTEIRPLLKYRLRGHASGGLALIASSGVNMVEDNPYTGLGSPPIVNFEVAADTSYGPWAAGVNVGYRHRTPGSALTGAPVAPLGSQWIASGAVSVLLSAVKSRFIVELFGSEPVRRATNRSDRMLSSAEVVVGMKHMATDALAMHVGMGRELTHGIASPDWRAYAGLNFALGPGVDRQQAQAVKRRHEQPPKKTSGELVARDFIPEDSDDPLVNDDIPEVGAPQVGEEVFVINNVMFAFDRDNLVVPGGRDILRKLAVYLLKAPQFKHLSIEGHTDFIGRDSYNQELSLRRANQIKRYLVEGLKLDGAKIDVVGYGESRPIADNGNFQGRQLNRRVEFKITR
jgi:outer membrane protein OmpA-like peptidoglycan-associated protein